MLRPRLSVLFALVVLLAGPLGLLSVEHGAFHHSGDDDAHGTPCPVCHFLSNTSMEAPSPEVRLPALVLVGVEPVTVASLPIVAPTFAPRRSRAPPALLS
jgi:hypothetical protein